MSCGWGTEDWKDGNGLSIGQLLSTLKGETLPYSPTHAWLPMTRAEEEDNWPARGRGRGEGEGRYQVLL